MTEDVAKLQEIYGASLVRVEKAVETYGVFNPNIDSREMLMEALEEVLDGMAYLGFKLWTLQLKLDERNRNEKANSSDAPHSNDSKCSL